MKKLAKKYCYYVEGTQFFFFFLHLKKKTWPQHMSRCTPFTESIEGLSQEEEVVQVTSLPISGMTPFKPETEGCSTLAVAGHRQGALPLPLVTSYSQADLIVSSITHSSVALYWFLS